MKIVTTRFGAIEVEDGAIVTFTQPIIGFQAHRRFTLLPGPPGSAVKWLQSMDSGELAFLIMDPRTVVADYEITLSSDERAELAVEAPAELDVYTLIVVPKDRTQVRTNLKAPILINPKQRLGKQVILERSDYPIQFFLSPETRAAQRATGGGYARTDA